SVVDSRGLATAPRLVYPVTSATAKAPTAGYAGRAVTVIGNAGRAPVRVSLSARQPGGSWTTVRSVPARSNGRYRVKLPLATSAGQQTAWRVMTGYGPAVSGAVAIQPVFAPTVTGPRRSAWHVQHDLTGTAVPGDVVTIWTAPAGATATSSRWVSRATVPAAADDT